MTSSAYEASATFEAVFRRPPDVTTSAPGRVNLIGEHTDYNDGFVLPIAIPQRTWVALGRREGPTVRAVSSSIAAHTPTTFELGREAKAGTWIDYVQGTIRALRNIGADVTGFDLAIASEIPIGGGLSSSAALEIAVLRALREAFALALDDVTLAKVGRAAETDFIGAPVGIMDQLASIFADEEAALFIDTRSLAHRRVPLPRDVEIVVIDSGIVHGHATGEYAARRAECERAARELGVTSLRDVLDPARVERLPEPLRRRARHVVTENLRVLDAVVRIESGDIARLGRLLDASHESLRVDFEVSVGEVDRLVAIAQADSDVLGARMTGGGFGGAIVALARAGHGQDAADRIVAAYGPRGAILVPSPHHSRSFG